MAKRALLGLVIAVVSGILVLCGPAWAAEPNLIAHWELDETSGSTASDSAGTNHGTVYGAAWTTGKINGALSFDGINDYVEGSSSPFDFEDTTFSVCAWVKTSTTKPGRIIVSEGGVYGGWILNLSDTGGFRVLLKRASSSDAYMADTTNTYNDGSWHHVAGVITTDTSSSSGNHADIYVDGSAVPVTEFKYSTYAAASVNWRIGSRTGTSPFYFDGKIDDVRIYDKALSAEEIELLYLGNVEPLDFAIKNIEEVIVEKEDILTKIDKLLDKEEDAYEALEEMLESKDYGDLKKGDIVKARQKIDSAMQHQVQAVDALEKSIEKFYDALTALGWEPEPEPDPNLVAHWMLDETSGSTASDSAGTNHGTVHGAAWTTGKINGALDFDGVNDYVNCGNGENLDNMAAITMSAWICPKGWGGTSYYPFGVGRILSKRIHPNSAYELCLSGNINSVMAAFYGDNGVADVFASENSIILNEWTHVTATNTGTEQKIYINGTESGSHNINSGDIKDAPMDLWIGQVTSGYVDVAFDGKIDDVRIYDKALSPIEVLLLYQSGL